MRPPVWNASVDHTSWQLGAALLFLGCSPPPPPLTPTATPSPPAARDVAQTSPAATPPARAPVEEPVCESTLRACKATETTRLRIGDSAASFHPPNGWNYAKEAEQSVAFSADRTAMLAFALVASTSKDDILETTKKLTTRLRIKNLKYAWLTPRIDQAQHELSAGPYAVELWEVNKSSQYGAAPKLEGELPGTLLLVVVTVDGQGTFVGTAFVTTPQGDEHAGAVMESLQTFRGRGAENTLEKTPDEPNP